MPEIVYIVTNEAMPGLLKIGLTKGELATRIKQLSQAPGVPLPFELAYAAEVEDAEVTEGLLHDAFGDHRVSRTREFFRIHPERVIAALKIGAKREISLLSSDVFSSPEEQAEVEVARRRRANFKFNMVNIPPGSVLTLRSDRTTTCRTLDEENRVEFRGEPTRLGVAANQAMQSLGYTGAYAGPLCWEYKGRLLEDIRQEIEERADG